MDLVRGTSNLVQVVPLLLPVSLTVAQRDDSRAAVDPDVILALSIACLRTNVQVWDGE